MNSFQNLSQAEAPQDVVHMLSRVSRLPDETIMIGYASMSEPGMGSGCSGKFHLTPQNLARIIQLAYVCQLVDASEITIPFQGEWSAPRIRTELDRFEICGDGSGIDEATVQVRAELGDDALLTSEIVRLSDLITVIEQAVEAGESEFWFGDASENSDALLEAKENFAMKLRPREESPGSRLN